MKTMGQRIEDLENRSFRRFDPSRPFLIYHYADDPPLDLKPEDGCPIVLMLSGTREEAALNKIKIEREYREGKAAFQARVSGRKRG